MVDLSRLKLNTKDPVYIQIALYIKKKILSGEISDGDPLPSRRDIAAMLEINPNTAQKAYKFMEDEGYVMTMGNAGSVIHIDDQIYSRIEAELTENMVKEFIQSAKDINLSFKKVFDLISDMWDDT